MSADPSVAPVAGNIPHLEGAMSSDPAQGIGLHHKTLDPSLNVLRRGRIEDVYMDRNCAVVAVMGYKRNIPCVWVSGVFNRWFGAKDLSAPSIGSEVAVIVSNDQKFGVILGCINAAGEKSEKPMVNLFGTTVTRDDDLQAHKSKDFGWASILVDAADGIHLDAFPGDDITVNAQGALTAILEMMASIRGGNGASVETFVFDQLLRITGYNLQERTSFHERNIMEDGGMATQERFGSHVFHEAMGNDPENSVNEKNCTISRRFHDFDGFLGGLLQRFIIRPSVKPADMTKAAEDMDLGLYQRFEHLSGAVFERSVTGGGTLKGVAIPVPKRKIAEDDPEGDTGAPPNNPVKPFVFNSDAGTPASNFCQLRDYFAWHFNKVAAERFKEKNKDWTIPEESDCPKLAEAKPPGIGSFYREFPEEVDAMSSSSDSDVSSDDSTGMNTRPGTAWCLVMPDGSVSIRDIWGSAITMAGGHIDISASKDVRIIAGGTAVVLGGDDCIIKGRQSVDITATNKQLRLRSEQEVFISSASGGMLINLDKAGRKFEKAQKGEEVGLIGVVIKSMEGGVTINANQLSLNLQDSLFINASEEGKPPPLIMGKIKGFYLKIEQGGGVAFDFDDGAFGISSDGYLFTSGNILGEKNLFIKKDGVFGGTISQEADFSGVEPVESIVSKIFENIDDFQWQYELSDFPELKFRFRRTSEYATSDGKWFESFWQREMEDTVRWKERPDIEGEEYPYPGGDHFVSEKSFWTYKEQNVEKSGISKARDSLNNSPSGFNGSSFSSFKVHPDR